MNPYDQVTDVALLTSVYLKRFTLSLLSTDKRYRKKANIARRRLDRQAVQLQRRTPLLHNGKKARR